MYNVYTDGSYMPESKKCYYGYIFVDKKTNLIEYKYVNHDTENTGLGCLYSELKAIIYAIKLAKQLNIKINIFTDCENALYFNLINKKQKYINKYSGFINYFIEFLNKNKKHYALNWVKGHSSDEYNNYIDKMLKKYNEEYGKIIKCKENIKYKRSEKSIDINLIKIPMTFQNTNPSNDKLNNIRNYYLKNLCFDKLISINTDYFLTDGYIRYLVAKEFGLSKIRINLAF